MALIYTENNIFSESINNTPEVNRPGYPIRILAVNSGVGLEDTDVFIDTNDVDGIFKNIIQRTIDTTKYRNDILSVKGFNQLYDQHHQSAMSISAFDGPPGDNGRVINGSNITFEDLPEELRDLFDVSNIQVLVMDTVSATRFYEQIPE